MRKRKVNKMITEKKSAPIAAPEPKKKLSKKVVSYSEYLNEALALLKEGPVNGMIKPSHVATALIYDRNVAIASILIKSETFYICEA